MIRSLKNICLGLHILVMHLRKARQKSVRQMVQSNVLYKQYDAERSCGRSGLQDEAFLKSKKG